MKLDILYQIDVWRCFGDVWIVLKVIMLAVLSTAVISLTVSVRFSSSVLVKHRQRKVADSSASQPCFIFIMKRELIESYL